MESLHRVLRALLRGALVEHGLNAPALVDIVIEVAAEPRIWAEFANGYRTSAPLRPEDCFAFCEAHAAWNMASLRLALRREALQVYLTMRREYQLERARTQRTWVSDQMRRLGRGIAHSLRTRRAHLIEDPDIGWFLDDRGSAAHQRGIRLLKENLSTEQLEQYERRAHFEVTGGKTGRRYRIRHGRSMNIDQLDKHGRRVCGWCFFPKGNLVAGDIMLAQKLAIELFEADALKTANKIW
jgi:hypothetical protein